MSTEDAKMTEPSAKAAPAQPRSLSDSAIGRGPPNRGPPEEEEDSLEDDEGDWDESDESSDGSSPAHPGRPRSVAEWFFQLRSMTTGLSDAGPFRDGDPLYNVSDIIRRTRSLPAVLIGPSQPKKKDDRPPPHPNAKLVIPRTVSEYFVMCRFARSHTDALLLAHTMPKDAFINCKKWVPRAFSEGLFGGRLLAAVRQNEARHKEQEEQPKKEPPPPKPVEELKEGMVVEGKIVNKSDEGIFIEIGATAPGLLRRKHYRGAPRRLMQKGRILANLVIKRVDRENRQFTMVLRGVDGSPVKEEGYVEVLNHIGDWAGVSVPASKGGRGPEIEEAGGKGKGKKPQNNKDKGAGKGQPKGEAAPEKIAAPAPGKAAQPQKPESGQDKRGKGKGQQKAEQSQEKRHSKGRAKGEAVQEAPAPAAGKGQTKAEPASGDAGQQKGNTRGQRGGKNRGGPKGAGKEGKDGGQQNFFGQQDGGQHMDPSAASGGKNQKGRRQQRDGKGNHNAQDQSQWDPYGAQSNQWQQNSMAQGQNSNHYAAGQWDTQGSDYNMGAPSRGNGYNTMGSANRGGDYNHMATVDRGGGYPGGHPGGHNQNQNQNWGGQDYGQSYNNTLRPGQIVASRHSGQPRGQRNAPGYGGQADFSRQPDYGGHPDYGGRPDFGGQGDYGGQGGYDMYGNDRYIADRYAAGPIDRNKQGWGGQGRGDQGAQCWGQQAPAPMQGNAWGNNNGGHYNDGYQGQVSHDGYAQRADWAGQAMSYDDGRQGNRGGGRQGGKGSEWSR